MYFTSILAPLAALMAAFVGAQAEQHTITFDNKCGRGTPYLKANGTTFSTGQAYTSGGPFISGIAYLQTGPCGDNGENCVLVETTLKNPTTPGSGSSTDLSLIPPHAFQITTGFRYTNGCDGQADCKEPNCPEAFETPDQTWKQVACQVDNVDLVITFCD
ncbi:glycopeptide [Gloeopeniophorella convolvens]|nr:glycopeptide [Gloeopeniophorella convolvens]